MKEDGLYINRVYTEKSKIRELGDLKVHNEVIPMAPLGTSGKRPLIVSTTHDMAREAFEKDREIMRLRKENAV